MNDKNKHSMRRAVRLHLVKEGCQHCRVTMLTYGTIVVMVPARLGFGDTVQSVIHTLTHIKPCAGCERRRKWLNRKFPYIGPVLRTIIDNTTQKTFPLDIIVSFEVFRNLLDELHVSRSVLDGTPWGRW